jgi:4-carboxymuconolactone decarboxylase
MNITDTAKRNHDALFPSRVSTLAATDPELIEIFDNWAFHDVPAEIGPDLRTRLMLQLAAIIASQAVNEYRAMLGAALNVGVSPIEIKEIVYQALPYVGIARLYDFLGATNEILLSRGITLPLEGQSTTTEETRFDSGLAIQKKIFGEQIDAMYENSPKDQLHIQTFLSANCFGDFYTRDGLPLKMRELLTFAMLAAMGGCEPQLAGHVAGNLAIGNDRSVLVGAVTQLLPFIGYPRSLNALRLINAATQGHCD